MEFQTLFGNAELCKDENKIYLLNELRCLFLLKHTPKKKKKGPFIFNKLITKLEFQK